MDGYASLAAFYDIENADLVEDLSVYYSLAAQQGDPILDVGCGTGRVAFALARRGYRVVGIDTSEAMLARARDKLARQPFDGDLVELREADVTQLALSGRFRLAIFAYNGFMHLLDQKDQLAALHAIRRHLTDDGALALDLPNPVEAYAAQDEVGLAVERVFEDPATGDTIMQQSTTRLDRARQLMHVTWVYDRIVSNGSVTRTLVPVVLRYTFLSEMMLMLEAAGLALRDVYGDYNFGPYDETSPRMLVVASSQAR